MNVLSCRNARFPLPSLISCVLALSIVFTSSAAHAIDVEVELTSGETLTPCQLESVTSSAIKISGAENRTIELKELIAIRRIDVRPFSQRPKLTAVLADSSEIRMDEVSFDDRNATLNPASKAPLTIPVKSLRSLRLRSGDPVSDPQWLGLLDKEQRGDVMVIRRNNGQLDPVAGVALSLSGETLKFSLSGREIDAPVNKLEGVIFRPPTEAPKRASVQIEDRNGSRYYARSLQSNSDEGRLSFLLSDDSKVSLPLKNILSIQWSSGQATLASLAAAQSNINPTVPSALDGALMNQWFGAKASGADLIAAANWTAEYRVEPGFLTLSGSVQRWQQTEAGGKVFVRISTDGNVQWEQTLQLDEAKGFRIPIAGAKRLRLEVLDGDDGDAGDMVRFIKPRLLK
ncbi:NPCBM/NEW2 domain protein [Stieleria bergensis]|uniref:NPCBM/NEW2 domain protein n=1 Tax=Stieleria bergensis TaxID=2528025 RepID=A0A517SR55_9BACT|nr:NPCBM/NEW2 domain protein [Planctomycetes bacterium SV_7m_r]